MRRDEPSRVWRLSAVGVVLSASIGLAASTSSDPASADNVRRAVELYDQAKYAGALELLEAIDADGKATGPLLYRLYYCQRVGGVTGSESTQLRAVELLERELSEARSIEVPFYLSNAYSNLGRTEDARRVTLGAASAVEAGDVAPADGVDMFRLGKLYADLGNTTEAANWYRGAVDRLIQRENASPTYIVWASRYLIEQAEATEDPSALEMYLTTLVEHGDPTADDLDRLAVARVRNQMYREAARAWGLAVTLRPADANRARYAQQLARVAARSAPLPDVAPGFGRPWSELARWELEELLKQQAGSARLIRAEAPQGEEIDEELRKELNRRLKDTRRVFAAAGLEYTLQGHDLREAAFGGGYAPLIFRSDQWKIARPSDGSAEASVDGEATEGKRRKRQRKRAGNASDD